MMTAVHVPRRLRQVQPLPCGTSGSYPVSREIGSRPCCGLDRL